VFQQIDIVDDPMAIQTLQRMRGQPITQEGEESSELRDADTLHAIRCARDLAYTRHLIAVTEKSDHEI
jgi:hypothetical protein